MYDVLYIYGGTGSGKTSLLQAMKEKMEAEHSEMKIGYFTAADFVNDFIQALRNQDVSGFRKHVRGYDVLMVDDFYEMQGKDNTQEEFITVFNDYYDQNKRIVITGLKPIDEYEDGFDPRIVSRLSWGIAVPLEKTNCDDCIAILRKQLSLLGAGAVPEDVIHLIGSRFSGDIRKMVGELKMVLSFAQLLGEEVTLDFAKRMLKAE